MKWGFKVTSAVGARNPSSGTTRGVEAVTQCAIQLRWAEDNVRSAGELLRRATRTAETAKAAYADAVRRLNRMDVGARKVGEA